MEERLENATQLLYTAGKDLRDCLAKANPVEKLILQDLLAATIALEGRIGAFADARDVMKKA